MKIQYFPTLYALSENRLKLALCRRIPEEDLRRGPIASDGILLEVSHLKVIDSIIYFIDYYNFFNETLLSSI